MITHTRSAFIFSAIIAAFASCTSDAPKQEAPKQDTLKKDTVMQVIKKEVKPAHPVYNDLARFIAGLPSNGQGAHDSLRNNPEWKSFSQAFENNWQKYDSTRLVKMKSWRETELTEASAASKTLFYPFAGADFLNAYTFFPDADQVVLIGLEPSGTPPTFTNASSKDTISKYFNRINSSLHAILNFSFFRTKSMAVDFRNEEIDGTIHLMLLFMARTGNTITDIKSVAVNRSGEIVHYNSFDEGRKDTLGNKGIEIEFMSPDSTMKKAYYFSVNLADDMLKKNTGFTAYVKSLGAFNSYIKSASYLMHKSYFSYVRDSMVLAQSRFILEDDSGIPIKHFDANTWDVTLYGSYDAPISMFAGHHQEDLKKAFKDSSNIKVKPLPFGIGYNYKPGKSNLLLAKRK